MDLNNVMLRTPSGTLWIWERKIKQKHCRNTCTCTWRTRTCCWQAMSIRILWIQINVERMSYTLHFICECLQGNKNKNTHTHKHKWALKKTFFWSGVAGNWSWRESNYYYNTCKVEYTSFRVVMLKRQAIEFNPCWRA